MDDFLPLHLLLGHFLKWATLYSLPLAQPEPAHRITDRIPVTTLASSVPGSRNTDFSHTKFVTFLFPPSQNQASPTRSLSLSNLHIKAPNRNPEMNGIRRRSNRKPEMEASLRNLRIQKPLSDCSNTVTDSAAASTQSSTASIGEIKRHNPKLSSVVNTLVSSLTAKNDAVSSLRGSAPSTPQVSSSVSGTSGYEVSEPSSVYSRRQTAVKRKITGKENDVPFSCPRTPKTRNVGKKTKQDGCNIQSKIDSTPIASTPTPRVSSSTFDTINRDVFEPHSVYGRRQTAQKRKSKGQENIGASSCPPALKIRNTWDNSNEDGQNRLSKKSKAPCKTKVLPAKKGTSEYTSPELEKQKAYFAELDKYELEEAEEWELE
ncbi:hypothetical protein ACLB2K_071377 [Fragaria x ananassa]